MEIKFLVQERDLEGYTSEESKLVLAIANSLSDEEGRKLLNRTLAQAETIMHCAGEYRSNDPDAPFDLQTELMDGYGINLTKHLSQKCIELRENNGSNLYTFLEIAQLIQAPIVFYPLDNDFEFTCEVEVWKENKNELLYYSTKIQIHH